MKPNKAPEKIYLYTEGHTLDNDWLYEAPEEFTSFEYTRTDAFIEKACDWLSLNMKMLMNVLDVEYDTHDIDIKDFIEDFKNYMKGE